MKTRVAVHVSRREAMELLLKGVGGALVVACGASETQSSGASTSGSSGSSTTADGGASGSAESWATGGTAAMSGTYPEPTFASAACVLAVAVTQGPCTEAADQVRKDVSEGYGGLPVRLALRVVDASCNPVGDAKVKIWHTQQTGSYSGDTPNPNMCLKSASEGTKHYFRGVQQTDAAGRVDFDTCFPGWYRGRTIHIHFTVTANGKSFTSQLVFDDALVASIFASHPEYVGYGQPDTKNANDNVVGNQSLATFTLDTARMADGAMLASKQLVVAV